MLLGSELGEPPSSLLPRVPCWPNPAAFYCIPEPGLTAWSVVPTGLSGPRLGEEVPSASFSRARLLCTAHLQEGPLCHLETRWEGGFLRLLSPRLLSPPAVPGPSAARVFRTVSRLQEIPARPLMTWTVFPKIHVLEPSLTPRTSDTGCI